MCHFSIRYLCKHSLGVLYITINRRTPNPQSLLQFPINQSPPPPQRENPKSQNKTIRVCIKEYKVVKNIENSNTNK